MDQIVEHKCHECSRNDALCQWKNEVQQQAIKNYNNAIRMTASISFKAGHSWLDGTTLERVRDINKQREEKLLAAARKQ